MEKVQCRSEILIYEARNCYAAIAVAATATAAGCCCVIIHTICGDKVVKCCWSDRIDNAIKVKAYLDEEYFVQKSKDLPHTIHPTFCSKRCNIEVLLVHIKFY